MAQVVEWQEHCVKYNDMVKAGTLSKADAERYKKACKPKPPGATPRGSGKQKKRAGDGDGGDGAPSGGRKPYPCSAPGVTLDVAETYASFKEGQAAVKKAFLANTLFEGISSRDDCTERAYRPSGTGGHDGRKYVDWEFEKDGKVYSCRCRRRSLPTRYSG